MKPFASKFVVAVLLCMYCVNQVFAATDIANFMIQISPNPLKVSEPADMTIKAMKADGSVLTDYQGTVLMGFEGAQDLNVYDFPSQGFYTFVPEDQGVKTFSKGLVIKKAGDYVVRVSDSVVDTVVGKLPIVVGSTSAESAGNGNKITLMEPLNGADIQSSAVNIVGQTVDKRAQIQVFVDDQQVSLSGMTDDTGNFSLYLTDLKEGSHTLQTKTTTIEGKTLGESDIVSFQYKLPATDGFLKSFVATPKGEVSIGDKIVFDSEVDGTVRNIEMKINGMDTFVMDRVSSGLFNKTVVLNQAGVYKVDVTLVFEGGQKTLYADRATFNVKGDEGISALKIVNNLADPSKVSLSWTDTSTPASYVIRYGETEDKLTKEIKSTIANVEISNLEIGKKYFFQVFSVDTQGVVSTKGSAIASVTTQGQSAAGENAVGSSCTVVGIKIRTEKIGDQYFLIRDPIPGAVEYHIYKSDYKVDSIESMQKIGSTSIPQFSYPFDATAKTDQYKFYSVVATCSDGQNLQIDNVKKVHTGPISDMLILFFVSLMCYLLYRIYRYN